MRSWKHPRNRFGGEMWASGNSLLAGRMLVHLLRHPTGLRACPEPVHEQRSYIYSGGFRVGSGRVNNCREFHPAAELLEFRLQRSQDVVDGSFTDQLLHGEILALRAILFQFFGSGRVIGGFDGVQFKSAVSKNSRPQGRAIEGDDDGRLVKGSDDGSALSGY